MSEALLRTKFFVPPLRHSLVARPRVTAKLDDGLRGKLTLVSAPAGFGKSTALSSWADASPNPVAWLSLDEGDNNPVRFWTYMSAALQTLIPAIDGAATIGTGTDPLHVTALESTVVSLLNGIATADDRRMQLIVDDYHLISAPQVNETLFFFLESLPRQLHVTLAGRTDPPWPLARLRARGELTEVRTPDLRFTTEETAIFLRDTMGLNLTPSQIDALEARTEGWIAGLQMAALSMRDRDDLAGFINALSGSHRFIMDYLLQEVLDKQPQTIRDFLLQTSILSLLTPDLCNAVTQRSDSETLLMKLEQANLFLEPQDDRRRWYRYHGLFADLLAERQERAHPDGTSELHRRASHWYEGMGQIGDAMNHAYAAGDVERQVQLLADNVLTMAYQGELSLLVQWLERLPASTGHHRPWVHISRAWIFVFAGRLDQVEPQVTEAERALTDAGDEYSADECEHLAGHIAALRGYVFGLQGDWQHSYEFAQEASTRMPKGNTIAHGWTILLLAVVLRAFGRLDEADAAFLEADAISRAAHFTPLTVDILWERSEMQRTQGKLQAALQSCLTVLDLAADYQRRTGRRLAPTGYIYAGIAAVLRERNELEDARFNANEGVRLCKRWGMADAVIRSHLQLAWVLQASGEMDAAQAAMDEARHVAEEMTPMYHTYVADAEAKLHLVQGKLELVDAWIAGQDVSVDDDFDDGPKAVHTLLAHLRVQQHARGRFHDIRPVLRLLDRIAQHVRQTGADGDLITILALKSIALATDDHGEDALSVLAEALHLGESERFMRAFLDLGAPMEDLLQEAQRHGLAVGYVRDLLAAFAAEADRAPHGLDVQPIDALTDRELDVLRLLPTSLSTVEIAEELVVAPSTVRTHIKSIYSKLQVNRRTDAVHRATELHLI